MDQKERALCSFGRRSCPIRSSLEGATRMSGVRGRRILPVLLGLPRRPNDSSGTRYSLQIALSRSQGFFKQLSVAWLNSVSPCGAHKRIVWRTRWRLPFAAATAFHCSPAWIWRAFALRAVPRAPRDLWSRRMSWSRSAWNAILPMRWSAFPWAEIRRRRKWIMQSRSCPRLSAVHNSSNNYPIVREQHVPFRNNSGFRALPDSIRKVVPTRKSIVSACHALDTADSLLYSQPLIVIALY